MKALLTFLGAILILIGGYFLYEGIQQKQTTSAKIENEAVSAIKLISNNKIKPDQNIKNESDKKLIIGGIGAALGLALLISGVSKKQAS